MIFYNEQNEWREGLICVSMCFCCLKLAKNNKNGDFLNTIPIFNTGAFKGNKFKAAEEIQLVLNQSSVSCFKMDVLLNRNLKFNRLNLKHFIVFLFFSVFAWNSFDLVYLFGYVQQTVLKFRFCHVLSKKLD